MAKIYCNNCNTVQPALRASTMLAPNWQQGVWLVCYTCRVKLKHIKPPPKFIPKSSKPPKPNTSPLIGLGGVAHTPKWVKRKYKRKG